MRVVFRADASVAQGSGHVMRCLTLAESIAARGDEVVFVGAIDSIPWLSDHVESAGYAQVRVKPHTLSLPGILGLAPDWVVVDSYVIPSDRITALAARVPVLAIVDGDARGVDATLYLDPNLGATAVAGRAQQSLAGSSFALVRDAVLDARRARPWEVEGTPRVAAFMGGTDPGGTIVGVAEQLALVDSPFDLLVVSPTAYHAAIRAAVGPGPTVIPPTPDLPTILAGSDVVVSASGTSAWDICTLGVPALLVGVVDNQSAGLSKAMESGLALGIDLVGGGSFEDVGPRVQALLTDGVLRERLSRVSTAAFDGLGKQRVLAAMLATLGE